MNRKVITEAFDHIPRWKLEHGAEERRFSDEEVFMDFEEKMAALEIHRQSTMTRYSEWNES